MNYVLQIDLVGAEKAQSFLEKLAALSGSLSSGGHGGGDSGKAARDTADIARSMQTGAKATSKMVSDLDKISSTGAKAAGTFIEVFRKGKSSGGFSPSQSFLKANPQLAAMLGGGGGTAASSDPAGMRGYGMADLAARFQKFLPSKVDFGLGNARGSKEAMDDLARHGGSQDMIDQAAKIALADAKQNEAMTKKRMKAEDDFEKARLKAIAMPDIFSKKYGGKSPPVLADLTKKSMMDHAAFIKNMSFMAAPVFNGSMWSNLFAGRQMFSAFMTQHGQGVLGKAGMSGIGGAAMATTGLLASLNAVHAALAVFKIALEAVINAMRKAMDYARKLYSEALTTGLSTQFLARRNISADVLGVDPKDVMRMQQMSMVTSRLRVAMDEISAGAPKLAYTGAQFKILEYDLLALGTTLATKLAPFVDIAIRIVDAFVKLADLFARIAPLILQLTTIGQVLDSILKIAEKFGLTGSFGPTQSFMKQLPASHWEKMGLVIGGGAGNVTNQLIRQSNKHLAIIAGAITGKNKNHLPNTTFGMNPQVANP